MRCGDEDGVTADAVHVDAGSSLDIIHVDIAILGDEESHAMLLACL